MKTKCDHTQRHHSKTKNRYKYRDTKTSIQDPPLIQESTIHVWHDSCATWLIHTCDMSRSCVWHDSFICVTWLIHMCDMTHLYAWHDSFIRVTRLIHVRDTTHSCMWRDSFIYVAYWGGEDCEGGAAVGATTAVASGETECISKSRAFWANFSGIRNPPSSTPPPAPPPPASPPPTLRASILGEANVSAANTVRCVHDVCYTWTWLIHTRVMYDMTCSYACDMMCVWCVSHMDMPYSYVCRVCVMCVSCVCHVCVMCVSCVWHDSFICVWLDVCMMCVTHGHDVCHTWTWCVSHMNMMCVTHEHDFPCITWLTVCFSFSIYERTHCVLVLFHIWKDSLCASCFPYMKWRIHMRDMMCACKCVDVCVWKCVGACAWKYVGVCVWTCVGVRVL